MAKATLSSILHGERPCVGRGLTSPVVETVDQSLGDNTRDGWRAQLKESLFKRFHILKSSPFRIGLTFWLLFMTSFGVSGLLFYETLQERLLSRIDQSIVERYTAVKDVFDSKGTEGVLDIAMKREELPMSTSMGFHLSTADGERIAGNVPICITEMGWDNLRGEDLGLENDNGYYRFLTLDLGGNVLSLGRSLEALEELRDIAFTCLIWTLLGSTVLAVLAALYIAHRTHIRMQGLSGALDEVAAGNLSARLPLSCADDDIDAMSSKINSSLVRLKQTVDGMRQVSTDIAHDLKTPLNRLYISIEDAASKSRAGDCVGDDLDGALDEAQGINSTFEALLRIAQIEAGARKSQFKHFDLASVLETAAEVYAPVVEEQCQNLHLDFDPSQSLPMLGDRDLMLQLIVNLIENAIHHCNDDTEIHFAAGQQDGTVWFSVADTGPGIPVAEREKVFQRLYRLERSRTTRGTGLGLSLVKAISDLHCGSIALEDNEPGLRVVVRFDRNCSSEA